MIKFFRKIRQRLLTENKFSKYLLYAVGEILLVIIGILIALKLNNLNNTQDLRQKEYTLLVEVRNNLEANMNEFNSSIKWQTQQIKNIEKIIDYSKKGYLWNDTLGIAITQFQNPEEFYVNSSGYNSLQSIGLDIISSDTVRQSITQLYDMHYTICAVRSNEYGQELFLVREPFMLENFSYNRSKDAMVPNNPGNILKNQRFINILSQRIRFKDVVIGTNQWSLGETKSVIKTISEHLSNLNR